MGKNYFSYLKQSFICSVIFTALLSLNVFAEPLKEIPSAKSFQIEVASAVKAGTPLVVFVSLDNCPFCKIARENYLLPLMNEQSIQVVQVNFRYQTSVADIRGNLMSQDQLVRSWGVKVAPTVLFLGKDGKELAPRLVGGSTSEFYGAYLDERIHAAQAAIRRDSILK